MHHVHGNEFRKLIAAVEDATQDATLNAFPSTDMDKISHQVDRPLSPAPWHRELLLVNQTVPGVDNLKRIIGTVVLLRARRAAVQFVAAGRFLNTGESG